ncbi:MAG: hypothetical protein RBR71_05255 [Gudongella sp.]|nr:hypothetical protein [Gudongella sp.]
MIKAYLLGISTLYEGESIEVRYRVFDGEELIIKKNLMLGYKKPAFVGHIAMRKLLKELERYADRKIVIYINDGALFETINGTSGTKKVEILERAKETRKDLKKFTDLEIINIDGKHEMIQEWIEILKP